MPKHIGGSTFALSYTQVTCSCVPERISRYLKARFAC